MEESDSFLTVQDIDAISGWAILVPSDWGVNLAIVFEDDSFDERVIFAMHRVGRKLLLDFPIGVIVLGDKQ